MSGNFGFLKTILGQKRAVAVSDDEPMPIVLVDPTTKLPYAATGGGGGGGGDASSTNQVAPLGSVAPSATVASKSTAIGGVYSSTLPTMTDGYQAAVRLGAKAQILHSVIDNTSGTYAQVTGNNIDNIGTTYGMAVQNFGRVYNGSTWSFMRGTSNGVYMLPGVPETVTGSVSAISVTGTTVAGATVVATIDNPNFRYKRAIIHITNNTAVALSDLVILTKGNPLDPSYDVTYTSADDYTRPVGYLQEVTINPATLASGTCRIMIDISIFSSLQIAGVVTSAVPGTNLSVRWIEFAT